MSPLGFEKVMSYYLWLFVVLPGVSTKKLVNYCDYFGNAISCYIPPDTANSCLMFTV